MKRLIIFLAVIFISVVSVAASETVYNVNFGLPNLTSIDSPVRVMKSGSTSDFICGFTTSGTYNENELMTAMNSTLKEAGVTFATVTSISKYWQGREYTITFRLTASDFVGDCRILRISNASSNVFEIAVVSDDDGILNAYTLSGEWDYENEDDFHLTMSGSQYRVTYKLKRNGAVVKTITGDGNPMDLGDFQGEGRHGTYMVEASLVGYTSIFSNQVTMENRFGLSNENHIAVKTYDSPEGTSYIMDVSYYDGLGFPVQDISIGGANDSRSIILPVEYDLMRRYSAKEYLPFSKQGLSGSFISDALSQQQDYYSGDDRAFVENTFENGLSGRLVSSQKAGDIYESADKKVNVTYGIYDGSYDICKLNWNKSNMMRPVIANLGSYSADELTYVRTVTEDNDTSMVFSDVFGKMVMSRRIDGGVNHDTYYVYDLRDSLACVIQPEGSAVMPPNMFTFTGDFWQKYCFSYIYDSRGNMTERHIPGCGAEVMAYDQRNRPVLYADAMMLADSISRYTIYDNMDRIVKEGYVKGLPSPERVQAALYAGTEVISIVDQLDEMVTRQMTYYSDEFSLGLPSYVPSEMRHIIDETYCRNLLARETVYEEPSAGGGLGRWEPGYAKTRSYFYDSYARPVVIHESDNTGWQSTYTYSYDFTGNVLRKTEEHKSSESSNSLICDYAYDSRGRMTSLVRTVNGQEMAPIAYLYDDLGRLGVKDFLGRGNQFYGYDMRGNLLLNASARNGEEIFSQTISYHSPLLPSSTPMFGGFISEITEKHVGNPLYATSYRYDHLGRMTGLSKTEDGDIPSYDWSETSVTYDRNGNLTSIINEGGLPNQVTHYNLDGNRLVSSGSLTGESALYQYYPDGNLKVDSKRNLQFGYNLLNLPQVVTSVGGGTHWARYAYLADGTKMYRKDMHHAGHIYRGSFVYRLEGGVQRLESIGYEEGRILATGHNDWGTAEEFIDTWHVTDHLGNVRAVVDITDTGEDVADVMELVLEQNDYRPFGERVDDERMEVDGENRYRFAGKEEQTFLNGVYSDFGARYHSSDIQRWTTPDPLAEKYYDLSPYAFCANNPINFVDPDGAKTYVVKRDSVYQVVGGVLDDDLNIYVVTYDESGNMIVGESIGKTTSNTSFYNTDPNEITGEKETGWMKGSIINPMDQSGIKFVLDLIQTDPSLISYMLNARNGEPYDFKVTNGTEGAIDGIDIYRGMPIMTDEKGVTTYTSARDVGNMMAGYVAGRKGLPWVIARLGFDGYQSRNKFFWTPEGKSTKNAQKVGWKQGRRTY